jgi:hypothetical protein
MASAKGSKKWVVIDAQGSTHIVEAVRAERDGVELSFYDGDENEVAGYRGFQSFAPLEATEPPS